MAMKKRVAFLELALICSISCAAIWASVGKATSANPHSRKTDASERIVVRAAGRGNPLITLRDGIETPTAHSNSALKERLFKQDQAQVRALASADFDEDGIADLVAGYGGLSNALSLSRGNADSIYPNSLAAQQRKSEGTFTDLAFLSPARLHEISESPDFMAAGDFDADGHWDLAAAARESKTLYLFSGDGQGNFLQAKEIGLPGKVTALASGDINRADGLTDLVIGITSDDGAKALVFEGPEGALESKPEIFSLPARAAALAVGQFDNDYLTDFAVAAGRELVIAHGRDRKLSLDAPHQAEVAQAITNRFLFAFDIKAIVAGDFAGTHETGFALLSSDGTVFVASNNPAQKSGQKKKKKKISEAERMGQWSGATGLACARLSTGPADDLLVLDGAEHEIRILMAAPSATVRTAAMRTVAMRAAASLETESEPLAALPMRLNGDALSDLVIIQSDHIAPAVVKTTAAQTFTVNKADDHDDSACDSGDCTLREAINAANANAGADTIAFNIPPAGTHTIMPVSPLPIITDPVTIDGSTQPGFAGSPIIEIKGNGIATGAGLHITAGNSIARGLVINNFSNGPAIILETNGTNRVEGNFIGTVVSGAAGGVPNDTGIVISESPNNVIGGTVAQARNIISGNSGDGVELNNSGLSSGNFIQGNYIGPDVSGNIKLGNGVSGVAMFAINSNVVGGTESGAGNVISGNTRFGISVTGFANRAQGNFIGTNASGTAAINNGEAGVTISNSQNHTIGGTTPAARNIISGNSGAGVFITEGGSTNNLVQGNFIGTDITGSVAVPNTSMVVNSSGGVSLNNAFFNMIGGAASGAGNVIAFNNRAGVVVIGPALPSTLAGVGNTISRNSIFSNNGLGIDLIGAAGVETNDACDGDLGGNRLQNFPVLTAAAPNGGSTNIQGTLNSAADTTFTIEFFANAACDASGFGEGKTFIGSIMARTSTNCGITFNITLPVSVAAGQLITATATDPIGNTSEFSACVPVVQGQSSFNLCLQDDSNGNLLRINSTTGEYQFTNCKGVTISGTASLTSRGCLVTLEVNGPDRRVLARFDTCLKTATASVQIFSQPATFTIMDRNTANNTCACAGG